MVRHTRDRLRSIGGLGGGDRIRERSKSPWILGHRGAPRLLSENTLASFEAALWAGADGVELDLQLTADGVLVVHHDPEIGGRTIRGLTLSRFRDIAPGAPTLAETLRFFESWPQARLNIELKPSLPPDGREAALADALAVWRGATRGGVWVSSFDPHALSRLSRLEVVVPLALLAAEEAHLDLRPCLPVEAVHPHHSLVTPDRMAAWRREGLAVHVWTVNDTALAAGLIDLGVDGLIGDDPAALVQVRDARLGT